MQINIYDLFGKKQKFSVFCLISELSVLDWHFSALHKFEVHLLGGEKLKQVQCAVTI